MSNKKIHVVLVINDFTVGGAQKLIIDQLKYFDDTKYTFSLITLFSFPKKADFYSLLPKDLPVYKLSFSGFRDIRGWIELYRLLTRLKPDVAISHLFFANTVTRVLKIFCGYVSITVEHNTYIHKTFFQILTDHALAYVTFRIIAVSETVASFTAHQQHISRKKFAVIYNGVDVKKIQKHVDTLPAKKTLKTELGFGENERIIVNVGRLTPQKNQALLIESFAGFVKKYPDYRLVILGEGGYRLKLEKKIQEYNLTDVVFLLGYKNPIPYYKVSDFLALTSEIEGFALVGIEGMACGLPMVSTKTAGPDEYLNDGANGFFIKSMDKESVVTAFEKMVSVKSISTNVVKNTAEKFDIQNMVRQYENLITSATEKW